MKVIKPIATAFRNGSGATAPISIKRSGGIKPIARRAIDFTTKSLSLSYQEVWWHKAHCNGTVGQYLRAEFKHYQEIWWHKAHCNGTVGQYLRAEFKHYQEVWWHKAHCNTCKSVNSRARVNSSIKRSGGIKPIASERNEGNG
jgi:hypothetical protein